MDVIKPPLQKPHGDKTQQDAQAEQVSAPPGLLWMMRAFAIAALAPFVISVAVMAVKGDPSAGPFAFALVVFSLPYLTILAGIRKSPDRVALTLAKFWGTLLALFSLLIVLPNLLSTGSASLSQRLGMLLLSILFFGSHAGLVFGAVKLTRALPPEPWSFGRALGAVARMGVFLFLLMIVSVYLPDALRSRGTTNDASAVGSTRLLIACAAGYSDAHPGEGFPADANQMGPQGSNCLDPVLTEAATEEERSKNGYRFRYLAAAKDAEGKISAFTVTARPTRFSRTGTRSYYSDETGVLRFTRENRPATQNDPPI